jgi:4-amino-4-deoxy-L-arabinose transferase-like glycosyltransferase
MNDPGARPVVVMPRSPGSFGPPRRFSRVALSLVALKASAHAGAAFFTPYEFHRDELLYFAMGTHLRPFGMDFPPLIALLSEALRGTVGVTVPGYRLLAAAFGTLVALVAVAIARELGGRRKAQTLVAAAVLFNPLFLRTATLFQPVVLDQLWWLLGFWAIARLARTREPRWWLLVGVAAGLGLLSKFSILFFGVAVLAGLLATGRRRDLLGPWPWIALGIALLLGSPSWIGQLRLGLPVLEQMSGLREGQLNRITLGEQLFGQAVWGPQLLLALAGLAGLLAARRLRTWRLLGLAALAGLVLFAAMKGKPYYSGPIHPVLYAAGGVWLESIRARRLRRTLAWALAGAIAAWGLFVLPFGLPVVPPEPMARYAAWTGIEAGTTTNQGVVLELPQDYADMLGWKQKAAAVAGVVETLTPEERATVVLYGRNYGQAGALDLYGSRMGLPPVVSLAGSWFHFGPGDRAGNPVVLLGVEPADLARVRCGSVEVVTRVRTRWGVPEERDVPVAVCRDPSITLRELWEQERETRVHRVTEARHGRPTRFRPPPGNPR